MFLDIDFEGIEFPTDYLAEDSDIVSIGGDLKVERLLLAYSQGIFPWYSSGPVVWWSPDPRFVLFPKNIIISKSMRALFKQEKFKVTLDSNFDAVIENCASIRREGQFGTWITEDMKVAYKQLHDLGFAHSVEVWEKDIMVGGLYGVALGKVFFGESMFTKVSNASKYGFITLVRYLIKNEFFLIDCQQNTNHLSSLGAEEIFRDDFLDLLKVNNSYPFLGRKWNL
jgi:leucyl/phenylalanyl-tRNA---protein transferase